MLPFALRGAFEILPDDLGHGSAARAEAALVHDHFAVADAAVGYVHAGILTLAKPQGCRRPR
jgi:hypothetical protein